jgi:sirohydrochlorin cobaltochelatase
VSEIRNFLAAQLARGPWALGQLWIEPGIVLRHADDAAPGAEIFGRAEDARELAKYDDAGNYRPLKTAPNLRHGWELRLGSVADLHLALDLFYPAALGTWLAFRRNELAATPLRATLGRQTGMYRVTQLIRDDQAEALIQKTCVEGCLRCRLWTIAGTRPIQNPKPSEANRSAAEIAEGKQPSTSSDKDSRQSEIQNPLVLCAEACNLLVAACRSPAKENLPKT